MTRDKKYNEKRRTALKNSVKGAIAVGTISATTASWNKPVINSIILPAHAVTSSKSLDVTNLTIYERDESNDGPLVVLKSITNPASGSSTNLGETQSSADIGAMSVAGVISPPPSPGTNVSLSATALNSVDSVLGDCFFTDRTTCSIELPVDSTDGEFSLTQEPVDGLDDGDNTFTVTFTCLDSPSVVLTLALID